MRADSVDDAVNWLIRTFGHAFVRKLGYIAAAAAVAVLAAFFNS